MLRGTHGIRPCIMADDDFLINTLGSGQQGGSSSGSYQGSSFYGEFESNPLGSRDSPTSYGNTLAEDHLVLSNTSKVYFGQRQKVRGNHSKFLRINNGLLGPSNFFSLNYSYINWKI